jgi:nitrite reductase (NADH) large subunit
MRGDALVKTHSFGEPQRQTLVIVGNGMTSWRLCHELVECGAVAELNVVVVGDERLPAYDRVRLTALLAGARPEDLLLAGEAWYAEAGIELLLGETVTQIDRDECLVRTARGHEILYDVLVLATGSVPFVPPIAGTEKRGVFVYRTVDDVEAIRAHVGARRRAVVIGGGLLGLEAARAVVDLGLEVDIVEAAPRLMARQLDDAASACLRAAIEALGVRVHVGTAPSAIEDEGGALLVRAGARAILADVVLLSAGVRPSSALARAAGLEVGASGGIVVDEHLRTSDDRIYAIGDCAAPAGVSQGLVAPGYRMASILAAQLTGGRATFRSQVPRAKLKLLGVSVASVGVAHDGPDVLALRHSGPGSHRALRLRAGRLVGALAVGPWPGFDRVARAVEEGLRIAPWELRRFRRRGEIWGESRASSVSEWPADAIICSCGQVTRAQIDAARAGGCPDAPSVCRATSAGLACGSCRPLVEELVEVAPLRASAARSAPRPSLPRAVVRCSGARPALVPRRATLPPFRAVRASQPILAVAPSRPPWEKGAKILLALLVAALVATVVVGLVAPVRALLSLERAQLSRSAERWVRLTTGYAAVRLIAGTLVLTIRKRWRRFTALDVPAWRTVHAALGLGAAACVAVHTRLHPGAALNRALFMDFCAALFLGAAAGVVFGGSHFLPTRSIRGLRLRFSGIHAAILWPFPALLVLHILAAYFYG